jgi:hypothetical protein
LQIETQVGLPRRLLLLLGEAKQEEIKKILMDGLKKTYDDPEYKKRFEKLGEEPRFGGPEFIEESIKKAEKLTEFDLVRKRADVEGQLAMRRFGLQAALGGRAMFA